MANKLTLEQIKDELKDLLGDKSVDKSVDGLPYVVIRTYSAGVHTGYLKRVDEQTQTVELVNTRRIYKFAGVFTLSELSQLGPLDPENCKFAMEIPAITLLEAIEIIPTSAVAQKLIQAVPNYKD